MILILALTRYLCVWLYIIGQGGGGGVGGDWRRRRRIFRRLILVSRTIVKLH